MLSVFANCPPNKMKGIVKTGAIDVAVVRLGDIAEISRPIPSEVLAVKNIMKYTFKKCM